MMMTRSAADELAYVRARIADLKARETVLEAGFRAMGCDARIAGLSADVVVTRTGYEVFDASKLPDDILNDRRYQSTKFVTRVCIEPHGAIHLPFIGQDRAAVAKAS